MEEWKGIYRTFPCPCPCPCSLQKEDICTRFSLPPTIDGTLVSFHEMTGFFLFAFGIVAGESLILICCSTLFTDSS